MMSLFWNQAPQSSYEGSRTHSLTVQSRRWTVNDISS